MLLDGSSYFTSSLPTNDNTSSWYAVAWPHNFDNSGTVFGCSADNGIQLRFASSSGALQLNRADVAAVAELSSPAGVTTGPQVISGVLNSGTGAKLGINLTRELDAGRFTFTSTTLYIGRMPTGFGNVNPFVGWLGDMLMHDTAHSDADAEATIGYLVSKWGIT